MEMAFLWWYSILFRAETPPLKPLYLSLSCINLYVQIPAITCNLILNMPNFEFISFSIFLFKSDPYLTWRC